MYDLVHGMTTDTYMHTQGHINSFSGLGCNNGVTSVFTRGWVVGFDPNFE